MSFIQFTKSLKNKKGQGLMEYLILVALVAVASIGVMRVVGSNVSRQYAKINKSIGGTNEAPAMLGTSTTDVEKKDLSDFMNGATR